MLLRSRPIISSPVSPIGERVYLERPAMSISIPDLMFATERANPILAIPQWTAQAGEIACLPHFLSDVFQAELLGATICSLSQCDAK
jgi:hypothetical protein